MGVYFFVKVTPAVSDNERSLMAYVISIHFPHSFGSASFRYLLFLKSIAEEIRNSFDRKFFVAHDSLTVKQYDAHDDDRKHNLTETGA